MFSFQQKMFIILDWFLEEKHLKYILVLVSIYLKLSIYSFIILGTFFDIKRWFLTKNHNFVLCKH